MTIAELAKPIESKVRACEEQQESWKQDHDLAQNVFNLQDLLGDVVECFNSLRRLDQLFLKRISKDAHAYDETLDNAIIVLSGRVHQLLESINSSLLPYFERHFEVVDNSDVFRKCLEYARESEKYGYRKEAHLRNTELADQIWDAIDSDTLNSDAA